MEWCCRRMTRMSRLNPFEVFPKNRSAGTMGGAACTESFRSTAAERPADCSSSGTWTVRWLWMFARNPTLEGSDAGARPSSILKRGRDISRYVQSTWKGAPNVSILLRFLSLSVHSGRVSPARFISVHSLCLCDVRGWGCRTSRRAPARVLLWKKMQHVIHSFLARNGEVCFGCRYP